MDNYIAILIAMVCLATTEGETEKKLPAVLELMQVAISHLFSISN